MSGHPDDPHGAQHVRKVLHRPPPTSKCGKVVRRILQLTDAQAIELARRTCKLWANPDDVSGQAVKLTWVAFFQEIPKC